MEALATFSKRYHLWVWRNPELDREVESLEIVPLAVRASSWRLITLGIRGRAPVPA